MSINGRYYYYHHHHHYYTQHNARKEETYYHHCHFCLNTIRIVLSSSLYRSWIEGTVHPRTGHEDLVGV